MLIQNGGNVFSVIKSLFNIALVIAISIFFGLINRLNFNPHTTDLSFIISFMMSSITLSFAKRIGRIDNRLKQISFKLIFFRHIARDFSKSIVVIPAENKTNFFSSVS